METIPNDVLVNIATLLNYDPITGQLTWKSNNELATVSNRKGYNKIIYYMHDGSKQTYPANRVIWIKTHGNIPENYLIDHINNDCSDDRLENLRLATYAENSQNAIKARNNKSGVKGVSFHKASGKWRIHIQTNSVNKYYGSFDDLEEAKQTSYKIREELHAQFTNHG